MAKPTNAEIEAKRAVIAEAREQALQAKAETIRVKAHNKACHRQRRSPCRKNRRHRPRRNRTQNQTRRAWQAKAAPAWLDPRHRHSPGSCRGHRADLPRSWHRAQMGVRRVHDLLAGTVRQFRLLSSGRLVTTGYRCAPSHRPYEHLFADRRHLYARFLRAHAILA